MKKLALGILGSGKGSNMVAIQEAILAGKLDAEIKIVISDIASAGILDRAAQFGLKARSLPTSQYKSKLEPELEEKIVRWLKEENVDLVVLAGYMRIIKEPLLKGFPKKIINIHPSLLPKFKGLEAWKQALKSGEKETGCTVHYVDAGVDTGEILAQKKVPIQPDDTAETLHARIQVAEHELLPEVIRKLG